jgi:hypothetical protein
MCRAVLLSGLVGPWREQFSDCGKRSRHTRKARQPAFNPTSQRNQVLQTPVCLCMVRAITTAPWVAKCCGSTADVVSQRQGHTHLATSLVAHRVVPRVAIRTAPTAAASDAAVPEGRLVRSGPPVKCGPVRSGRLASGRSSASFSHATRPCDGLCSNMRGVSHSEQCDAHLNERNWLCALTITAAGEPCAAR